MTEPRWVAWDRRHLWHPYTQHGAAPPAVPIVRAHGSYLYTADGRALLDAISSWWVTIHGHAHPVIAEAIAAQARVLEQVIFAGFTHEPAARLAAELLPRLPGGPTRLFLSDDGSTAVEVALKIALQYWRNQGQTRPLIAALEHAYHGDTFGAMSVSARGVFTAAVEPLLWEVARLPDPTDEAVVPAFERLLERRGRELAALIVEPLLQGAGGMRMYPASTLRALAERCRAAGVLLIADEVLTGFGRTGPLFACEAAGVAPDIVCLSKGLTGGFLPLGATAVQEHVWAAFFDTDRRKTLFHGHSYTANPLACAAACASLALLDDACAARRAALEAAHRRGLARLASHPRVRCPRVLGTVAAFDLVDDRHPLDDRVAATSAPFDLEAEVGYLSPIGQRVARFALERGVLLRPLGDVVYVLPPYSTTPDELASVYDVLVEFLEREA